MKNKQQLWEEIEVEAQTFREKNSELGLTQEMAIDRVMTPERHREYREAPEGAPVSRQDASQDIWEGRGREKVVYDRIMVKATELRKKRPELTEAQAFDEVWVAHPEVRTELRNAQEADRGAVEGRTAPNKPVTASERRATEGAQSFEVTEGSETFRIALPVWEVERLRALSRAQR